MLSVDAFDCGYTPGMFLRHITCVSNGPNKAGPLARGVNDDFGHTVALDNSIRGVRFGHFAASGVSILKVSFLVSCRSEFQN
jgi:hypothetical protein